MLIPPPDPRLVPPAELFRALLDPRPRRAFEVEFSEVGRVVLFARAVGSHEWVTIHRAFVRQAEAGDPRAEADYLGRFVVDEQGASVLSADVVLGLYDHEAAELFTAATDALRTISPTMAAADVGPWLERLKEGAVAPENLPDTLSLGGCRSVSWGFGKGLVHVRDEPEAFFGFPRRELIDAHWLAYHAAARARAEIMK